MVVRFKDKERYQGSVTPSALNSETTIIELGDQSDDYIIEGQISLQNMQSGDIVVVKVYCAIDGTNQILSDSMTIDTVPDNKVVRIPAITLPYNAKFKVTVMQTSGTLREFPYSFILQIMEEI